MALTSRRWREHVRFDDGPIHVEEPESPAAVAPLLPSLVEASASGVIATGPRRGCRIVRVRGVVDDVDAFVMGRLCAQVEGYDLQAATRIAANDRDGLERMARYLARPPIASDRLTQLEDGRLELRPKRPWRDGTLALRCSPQELVERLVGLVPRPRAHLTRYHGVLAPPFAARQAIVPKSSEESGLAPGRPVFLEDVLACARCSGRMVIVAAITSPSGVAPILQSLGLPTQPPRFQPARPPPQGELLFDGSERDPPAPDHFDT